MIKDTDFLGSTYYLQRDKINDLYGKMMGEVVEKIISREEETSGKSFESNLSLGKVLTWLGLDAKIGGGLTNEKATSKEVVKELPIENKLLIALNALEKEGKCHNLNVSLGQGVELKGYVYFKGYADFGLKNENPEQFIVSGKVEDFEFKSFCSQSSIFSPSLRGFLLAMSNEIGTLPIFCAGYIMALKEKTLFLTLYYIGGL